MTGVKEEALSYYERWLLLTLNPVVITKHFKYHVEIFFKKVLKTNANPIGKKIYHAFRIEFKMRGSPHLHAFIWTSDYPKLTHLGLHRICRQACPGISSKLHEVVAISTKNTLICKNT